MTAAAEDDARGAPLRARLAARQARVCVVGQGYVGLSVALAAARSGLSVHGVDVDAALIAHLQAGELVVPGVAEPDFRAALATDAITFGTDPAAVADADVVLVCVPTPVHEHRPDLAAVKEAGRQIGRYLRPGSLVVLESTTYPGTTQDVLRPALEAQGMSADRDFLLAYSPERIDPGNQDYPFATVPRVVGGIGRAATQTATAFYELFVEQVHPVSSPRAAEMAKLLENTYRMVNIALVNELAMVCHEQGLSPWEVIDAATTKPYGFARFVPGPGVGGHCIPIDPTYLTWQSRRDTGRPYRLVELAQDINAEMPAYVAARVADLLNDRGMAVRGSRLLALGVTYKPDVGDVRESAAVHVIDRLAAKGAEISFHDPFIASIDRTGVKLDRTELTDEAVADADLVLLLTPHSSYDLPRIRSKARHIFDARNALGQDVNVTTL